MTEEASVFRVEDEKITFEIREVSEEDRTVSGVAIPYGEDSQGVKGYTERIERGAFDDAQVGIPFYWNHEYVNGDGTYNRSATPVGSVTEIKHEDDGLHVRAKFANTPKGDEVYTLAKEGHLKSFSAGFNVLKSRTESGGIVVRTKAKLNEVSIVTAGAYASAAVSEVRAADNNKEIKEIKMDNTNSAPEVVELREAFNDLERKVAVLSERGDDNSVVSVDSQYRTGGDYLKGLLHGEDAAKTELRAYTGATTADTNVQPAWANRTVKLVQENRDVLNLFSKAPHPGSTSVTLPVLGGVSGTVGKQASEGADLPYMEIQFADETFLNDTYGGYSALSRQAIELGTPGYLSKVLEFQALQYAKATNDAVRTAVLGATGTPTATLAADSFTGWADLIVDAASTLGSNGSGVQAEFVVVSTDVFKRLAHLEDGAKRPLLVVNGDGVNTVGNANIQGLKGSILGLPVVVDGAAPDNTCIIANSEAVTVMESAGAPVRLTDDNIINLTKEFSLYGYMIVGVTNKLAIVKVDADLA